MIGGAAAAGCDGPSLIDRLSPDQLARLQAAAEATPYGEGILWSAFGTTGQRCTAVKRILAQEAPGFDN